MPMNRAELTCEELGDRQHFFKQYTLNLGEPAVPIYNKHVNAKVYVGNHKPRLPIKPVFSPVKFTVN